MMKVAGGSVDFAQRGGLSGPPQNYSRCTCQYTWDTSCASLTWSTVDPITVAESARILVYPDVVLYGEEPGPGFRFYCMTCCMFIAWPCIPCTCVYCCLMLNRSIDVNGMVFSINSATATVECTVCCKHWHSEDVFTMPNIQGVELQMVRKKEIPYSAGGEDSPAIPKHDLHYEVLHILFVDRDGVMKRFTTKELGHPRKHFYNRHKTSIFAAPTYTPCTSMEPSYFGPMVAGVQALIVRAGNAAPQGVQMERSTGPELNQPAFGSAQSRAAYVALPVYDGTVAVDVDPVVAVPV